MFSGTPSVPALGTFFHADVLLARYSQVRGCVSSLFVSPSLRSLGHIALLSSELHMTCLRCIKHLAFAVRLLTS